MIITIIIPTYNRAEFLPRALASIAQQTCNATFDILIVDDGSTDDTPAVCAALAEKIPGIRIVRQENTGVAGARNTGLRNLLPETDVVTFLDSDDALGPDRFSADLPHLEDPEIDLTYARMMHVADFDDATLMPTEGGECTSIRSVQLSCGLFRRNLIEKTGFFSEDMEQAEDTDYLYRVFEEGARWSETDTIAVYYIRHDGNMTNAKQVSQRYSAKALLRSIKRRRDDPRRSSIMPQLGMTKDQDIEAQ